MKKSIKKPCVKDVQIQRLATVLSIVNMYLTDKGLDEDFGKWVDERKKGREPE